MLIEGVQSGFALAGEHVQRMLDATTAGALALRDSWRTLSSLDEQERGNDDLQAAMGKIAEAYVLLRKAHMIAGLYSATINPYLERVGMRPVGAPVVQRIPTLHNPQEAGCTHDYLEEDMQLYTGRFRRLRMLLDNGKNPREVEGYINSGAQYHVFNNGDGTVLKVPRDARFPNILPDIKTHVARMSRDTANIEKVCGYTTALGGALVAEYVPGKTVATMSDAELAAVPEEHFIGLARLIRTIRERGIAPDYHPTNVIYNPREGFVLIDNHMNLHRDASQEYIDIEAWCVPIIFSVGGPEEKTLAIERFWSAFLQVYPDSELWRIVQ